MNRKTRHPTEPVLDHALLIAGAAVSQASSSTAILADRLARPQRDQAGDSLTALVQLLAEQDAGAVAELSGSFHPRIAHASAGKARSRLMKPGFTLAF
jgi:homoserine kinase